MGADREKEVLFVFMIIDIKETYLEMIYKVFFIKLTIAYYNGRQPPLS